MSNEGDGSDRAAGEAGRDKRRDRLKLALRENLKRRKSQARERADFTPSSPVSDEMPRDGSKQVPGK